MTNPWVLLAIGLAWLASLVGVGMWQREDGATAELAKHQAQDNAALVAANAAIDRLNRAARATEEAHQDRIAVIGASHAKDRENLEARRRRDVADARDGALKLRIPGACPRPGGSAAPEAGTPATGGDDATTGELPGPIAAALLDLGNEADIVTRQLTACQAVVLSDRSTSKGDSP